jgi:hypothetical protein
MRHWYVRVHPVAFVLTKMLIEIVTGRISCCTLEDCIRTVSRGYEVSLLSPKDAKITDIRDVR